MSEAMILAFDFGTTQIKAGLFDAQGQLIAKKKCQAPVLNTSNGKIESDALKYCMLAENLWQLMPHSGQLKVGIASQRSSFLLWDAKNGNPITPLISWQDRRAETWCKEQEEEGKIRTPLTGLPLSSHYLAPKLAWLLNETPSLRGNLEKREILWGTLDSYFIYRNSVTKTWCMDTTMASRSWLAAAPTGRWHNSLFQFFNIPHTHRPATSSSRLRGLALRQGGHLHLTLADQAAGLWGALEGNEQAIWVNLGTGGFVLKPVDHFSIQPPYLTGLCLQHGLKRKYAVEGTVNGLVSGFQPYSHLKLSLWDTDPLPDGYVMPDNSGWGTPYLNPAGITTFSALAKEAPLEIQGILYLEGVAFRIAEIIEALATSIDKEIFLSGGFSKTTPLAQMIALTLGSPIHHLDDPDITLTGAAALTARKPFKTFPQSSVISASPGHYLQKKWRGWQKWNQGLQG